jgi:hypothetical protein
LMRMTGDEAIYLSVRVRILQAVHG